MGAKPRRRPDWSRPLPQPLQILDENYKPMLTVKTLGDVRKMLLGLPEPFQLKHQATGPRRGHARRSSPRGRRHGCRGAAAHGAGYGGHCVTAEMIAYSGR